MVCDLSNILSVKNLVNICLMEHKEINILINNADIQNNYYWVEEKMAIIKLKMRFG